MTSVSIHNNQRNPPKSEVSFTNYHAQYFAYELTRRHSSGSIRKLAASLQDAQVDMNPHQVQAALFAFQSPLSKGALLADEVGLGKTIEAGIILSQMWAERKQRLLIICPANLRKQWNQELLDKFFIPSVILDSKAFKNEIKRGNDNPFVQEGIVICSFEFARSKEEFLRNQPWDLVIIDEAHRLRNVYKSSNRTGRSIRRSLGGIKKILLTATPLQNSLLELYGLTSIIDMHTFGDVKSFKGQYINVTGTPDLKGLRNRLSKVCHRTLRKDVLAYIRYTSRTAIVESFTPYEDEQELYRLVTKYLHRPELFALPVSQRQLITLILRKLMASSSFAIQQTFDKMADRLDALLQNRTALSDMVNEDIETYGELSEEWEVEDVAIEDLHPDAIAALTKERDELRSFASKARAVHKNSKGDKLLTGLRKGFAQMEKHGAPQKAIIFTEFSRTQQYINEILQSNGFEGKTVLFNGSNKDEQSKQIYRDWLELHEGTDRITGSVESDKRQAIVDYFRDEATIMIATEAAAEGINLQFCSMVVNYDLPWNPQRIEQRIGRCHRYGQKHDVVVINFLNQTNAADLRVYDLLQNKFQLFEGVFGASDEVLGAIGNGVDFEKRVASIVQDCRHPDDIKQAFDALQDEMRPEIESQMKDTKQKLIDNFDEDVRTKLRVSFEEGKAYLNLYETWLWNITKHYLRDDAEFDHSEDSFLLNRNPFPDEPIHRGPYQILRTNTDKRKTEIKVAVDTNIYRSGHPLAKRIMDACRKQDLPPAEIEFDYSDTPTRISILEPYQGKSGVMRMSLLSVETFDVEEHLLLSARTDDEEMLDAEICSKFFSIDAQILSQDSVIIDSSVLDEADHAQRQEILERTMERNNTYFDEEYAKLDAWAEDMRLSLDKTIKDLDKEIKLKKGEARKLLKLEDKVAAQREIKELESKRQEKRQDLFNAQDEIEQKKENILAETERKLEQNVKTTEVFTIRWRMI